MYINTTTNLMVKSIEESLLFYQDILGFTEIASVKNEAGLYDFIILNKDNANLMLQQKESLVSEFPSYAVETIAPSVTLYTMVDNYEEYYSELKSKLELYLERHTTPYGADEFAIADPDGYVLVFTEQKEQ